MAIMTPAIKATHMASIKQLENAMSKNAQQATVSQATEIGMFDGFNVVARVVSSNGNEVTVKFWAYTQTYMRVRTVSLVLINDQDTAKDALIRLLSK